MSCIRGALKQIATLYKSYLKSCLQSSISVASHENLVDPFLCMNIKCPPGSYDPNIEPAKDDILFLEPEGVLQTVERFFTHIYGQIKLSTPKLSVSDTPTSQQEGFELLLRRKADVITPVSYHSSHAGRVAGTSNSVNELPGHEDALFLERSSDILSLVNKSTLWERALNTTVSDDGNKNLVDSSSQLLLGETRAWASSMYDGDEDDDYYLQRDSELHDMTNVEDEECASKSVRHFNPWSIAKMNAPVRRIQPVTQTEAFKDAVYSEQLLTPERNRAEGTVYSAPWPPLSRISPNSSLAGTSPSLPSPAATVRTTEDLSSPSTIAFSTNPWVKRNYLADVPCTADLQDNGNGQRFTSRQPRNDTVVGNDFISARNVPNGTPLAKIPDATGRSRNLSQRKQQGYEQQQGKQHTTYVPPMTRSEPVWSETGPVQSPGQVRKDSSTNDIRVESAKKVNIGFNSSISLGPSMYPNLAATLDFESRKLAATHSRKAQLHQQTLDAVIPQIDGQHIPRPAVPNSPHKNRYMKAVAALGSSGIPIDPQQAVLKEGDPRGHLVQVLHEGTGQGHHNSIAGGHKLKRPKTAHLPFESVPVGQAVHDLVMTIDTAASMVTREATKLTGYDGYIKCGRTVDGLKCTLADAILWNGALQKILEESFREGEGCKEDVVVDLWTILQNHCASLKDGIDISDT